MLPSWTFSPLNPRQIPCVGMLSRSLHGNFSEVFVMISIKALASSVNFSDLGNLSSTVLAGDYLRNPRVEQVLSCVAKLEYAIAVEETLKFIMKDGI